MNALKLSFTIVLLLNPFSKASFVPLLKEGLGELIHLFNPRHSLTFILFPDPVESKNIIIKLGFIGALDKSLRATASLGQELVSLLHTESYNSLQYSMLSSWLTNSTCVLVFLQSSAFKIAIELINADAAKNGGKIEFSMDFKSEFLFPFLIRNWLKAVMN